MLLRCRALLLLAAFALGGGGLQLLDGVVYHSSTVRTPVTGAQLYADTPASHIAQCVLGWSAAVSRPAHGAPGGLRLVTIEFPQHPALAASAPRAVRPTGSTQPRAPPVRAA
jgi:hypothetical protein